MLLKASLMALAALAVSSAHSIGYGVLIDVDGGGSFPLNGISCKCQNVGDIDKTQDCPFDEEALRKAVKSPGYFGVRGPSGTKQNGITPWSMEYKIDGTNYKTITFQWQEYENQPGYIDFLYGYTSLEYTPIAGSKEKYIVKRYCTEPSNN